MNRNQYDPDEAPRSALGSDDVTFEPPPQYKTAGSVHMSTPTPRQYTPQTLVAAKPAVNEPPFEWRKPTPAEERAAFLELFYKINLHRVITMNHQGVVECLERIDGYVASHSDHNGERTEAEVLQNINRGFWTYIALDPSKGKKLIVPKEAKPEVPVAVKRKPGRPRKNPDAPVRVRKVAKKDSKPASQQIDGDVFQG